MIWISHVYGTCNMHFTTGATLIFLQYSLQYVQRFYYWAKASVCTVKFQENQYLFKISRKIVRATGTFYLEIPEWRTLCVIFGAFLKLASSRQSFSKTSWNNFHKIYPPLHDIRSSKLSYSKAGNMKRWQFNKLFLMFLIRRAVSWSK